MLEFDDPTLFAEDAATTYVTSDARTSIGMSASAPRRQAVIRIAHRMASAFGLHSGKLAKNMTAS